LGRIFKSFLVKVMAKPIFTELTKGCITKRALHKDYWQLANNL
jgi:hypothetical protein